MTTKVPKFQIQERALSAKKKPTSNNQNPNNPEALQRNPQPNELANRHLHIFQAFCQAWHVVVGDDNPTF